MIFLFYKNTKVIKVCRFDWLDGLIDFIFDLVNFFIPFF